MPIHIRGFQIATIVNPVVDMHKTLGTHGDTLVAAVWCTGWFGDIGAEFAVGFTASMPARLIDDPGRISAVSD